MSNELALTSKSHVPTDHEMMVYSTMAKHAVTSKMYKGIGDESAVMMIMLASRELGLSPMMCLNGGLNIINGKVEISARMMSALIRKAGHQIKIQESTDTTCVLIGKRCDTGEQESVSFTIGDAQKAGLVKQGGGWTKFPKDMLFARALSRLARQLFSDVIGIGYVEGEIKATESQIESMEEIVIEEEPQKDEEDFQKMLSMFDPEDHYLVAEYLFIVMKHFAWSKRETIQKFLQDPRLIEKFTAWKNKRLIATQSNSINDER